MFLKHIDCCVSKDPITFLIEFFEKEAERLTHHESRLNHIRVEAQRQKLLHDRDVEPKQPLVLFESLVGRKIRKVCDFV
jgi:hypothetical protein